MRQNKSEDNLKNEEELVDLDTSKIDEISGDDLKMVFIVREDLKMGLGKQCSQVAHAAIRLCSQILEGKNAYQKKCMELWDDCGSKKVVLKTNSQSQLKDLYLKCQKNGINAILISDAGKTQTEPGSETVLGIGPDDNDKINTISGKLRLL